MDIGSIFTLKQSWNRFCADHPKFPEFLLAVKNRGLTENTELTFVVTYPDGQNMKAGVRLKPSDVETFEKLIALLGGK